MIKQTDKSIKQIRLKDTEERTVSEILDISEHQSKSEVKNKT